MAEPERDAHDAIAWEPQPGPQTALIRCPVFEVFFGGARGGGKTDGMLGDFIEHADAYGQHAIGLMVRRRRTELLETVERSRQMYWPLGWKFHEQKNMWQAPNGARLRFAYLERDADAESYQGHSYTRVYVEEIGNFPSEKPVLKLMATLRSGAGVPCGFRATGNPGGPGHNWVRARYIDPAPLGYRVVRDPLSGLERVYIPSRVSDNHYLGDDYVQRLKASGSRELVRAWLEGDWSVIEGAFFDCWGPQHVIAPFAIPDHWLRFRSMDWGSASPFSVGWWAVASDDYTPPGPGRSDLGAGRDDILPRGALVRYREWYGASAPNVGLKLTAEDVAAKVVEKSANETYAYTVVDPSMFRQDGGPSLAERMIRAKLTGLKPGDNTRIPLKGAMGGWDQMRARLVGDGDGRPMIYCFATCTDSVRTIPVLQHDPDRPEDLDTNGEDHAADEWRYACMSRPWAKPAEPAPSKKQFRIGEGNEVSLDDLWKAQPKRRRYI
jgi:hypothetical protein